MFHRNRITRHSDSNDIRTSCFLPLAHVLCIFLLRLHRKGDGNKSISTWSENYKLRPRIYSYRILVNRVISRVSYRYENDFHLYIKKKKTRATSRNSFRVRISKLHPFSFPSIVNFGIRAIISLAFFQY